MFCAFDTVLYVITAEEEFHNFWLLLMSVEQDASVCRSCRGFIALINLSFVLLFGNSLLGEASLCQSLGQPCDVPLHLLTSSLMDSNDMSRSSYVDLGCWVLGPLET